MQQTLKDVGEKFEEEFDELPTWEPDECPYIEGGLFEYKYVDANGNPRTPLLILRNTEYPKGINVWPNGVLERKLQKVGVGLGWDIGIEFKGWRESKAGRKYRDFDLYFRRPEPLNKGGQA